VYSDALQKLNALGYAQKDSGLILNLVFNPQGMALPAPQLELETAYRAFLSEHFDLQFNQLFTITNMPIQRFGAVLHAQGQFDEYLNRLQRSITCKPCFLASVTNQRKSGFISGDPPVKSRY
jgi:hypothetical protein